MCSGAIGLCYPASSVTTWGGKKQETEALQTVIFLWWRAGTQKFGNCYRRVVPNVLLPSAASVVVCHSNKAKKAKLLSFPSSCWQRGRAWTSAKFFPFLTVSLFPQAKNSPTPLTPWWRRSAATCSMCWLTSTGRTLKRQWHWTCRATWTLSMHISLFS